MQTASDLDGQAVVPGGELHPGLDADPADRVVPSVDDRVAERHRIGQIGEDRRGGARCGLDVEHDLVGPADRRCAHLHLEGSTSVDDDGADHPGAVGVDEVTQLAQLGGIGDGCSHGRQDGHEGLGRGHPSTALRVPVGGLHAQLRREPAQLAEIGRVVTDPLVHGPPPMSASRSSCTPRIGMSAQVGRLFSS